MTSTIPFPDLSRVLPEYHIFREVFSEATATLLLLTICTPAPLTYNMTPVHLEIVCIPYPYQKDNLWGNTFMMPIPVGAGFFFVEKTLRPHIEYWASASSVAHPGETSLLPLCPGLYSVSRFRHSSAILHTSCSIVPFTPALLPSDSQHTHLIKATHTTQATLTCFQ